MCAHAELDVGRVHQWVELDLAGLGRVFEVLDELGWVTVYRSVTTINYEELLLKC